MHKPLQGIDIFVLCVVAKIFFLLFYPLSFFSFIVFILILNVVVPNIETRLYFFSMENKESM